MHTMADAILVESSMTTATVCRMASSGSRDRLPQEGPSSATSPGTWCVVVASMPLWPSAAVLAHIEGRANDCVVTSDGRVMHGQSLISQLMEIEGIVQFRIRQTRVAGFHLQLVCSERYQRTVAEERIRNGWNQVLRVSAVVTFEYLSRIPAEPRGKFRHIVCDVPIDSRGLASVPTTS
jgi:hypothetical protein